jgi:parallel beta-helix repeat protein
MKSIVTAFMVTLILIGMLTFTLDIKPVRANGTIYIRADGSIDPPTAPITTADNVTYIFIGNINSDADGIVAERSNIIIDGAGYTLQGTGSGIGFDWFGINNVTIKHTNIKDFYIGITLDYSSNSSIQGNRITNNVYGITLGSSSSSSVSGNNITTIWCGIELLDSSGNNVSENTIANSLYGFWLSYSSNNSLSGNIMTNNPHSLHLESSPDTHIIGNNVTDTEQGIVLQHSPACDIAGNFITNTASGSTLEPNAIRLLGSNDSMIRGNEVNMVDGIYDVVYGIHLGNNSFHCLIEGNNILGPQFTKAVGIALDNCQNITLRQNTISGTVSGGGIGIVTDSTCKTLLIVENTIAGWYFGLWPFTSPTPSGNLAYHNNFVNNAGQVVQGILQSPWKWDDDYPSGGNYWSDYTGSNVKSGPLQDQPGSDGIGDSPYVINSNNQDRYPLMKPYPWDPHDLGITDLAASRAVLGQGYSLHVNVTMFNYGNNTEHFNVTIYANTTLIHTFEDITLTSRNSTTITFTCNTTGWAKGNYTLTAVADTVLGETDTADNTFIGGRVMVTLPGDVDGDQDVDIFDIVRMAGVYGISAPDIRYNPNCDIDGDNDIDIFDIVIAAGHYGESW